MSYRPRVVGYLASEDYFCWRWACYLKLSYDNEAAESISRVDASVLDAILANSELYSLIAKWATQFYDEKLHQNLIMQLFEVYGDNPSLLVHMWNWADSCSDMKDFYVDEKIFAHGPDSDMPPMKQGFLHRLLDDAMSLWPSLEGHLKTDVALSLEVTHGEHFKKHPEDPITPSFWLIQTNMMLGGFQIFIGRQYYRIVSSTMQQRLNILKLNPETPDRVRSLLETTKRTKIDRGTSSIVFSVAGSGKTQCLFDQLCSQFGHYIVSGKVQDLNSDPKSLLNARKGLGSNDSHFLESGLKPNRSNFERAYWTLAWNRRYALQQLYSHFGDKLEPWHWLLYQLICTAKFDPFLESFKVALLCATPPFLGDSTPNKIADNREGDMFCFDEAQCELSNMIRSSGNVEHVHLSAIVKALGSVFYRIEPTAIQLSGTSLRLEDCMEVLLSHTEVWSNFDHTAKVSFRKRDQQDLSTRDDFKDLFSSELWTDSSGDGKVSFGELQELTSGEAFEELFRGHTNRILRQMLYLVKLDQTQVTDLELWTVWTPSSTDVEPEDLWAIMKEVMTSSGKKEKDPVAKVAGVFETALGLNDAASKPLLLDDLSRPFRGRIRWSALFIEQLLVSFLKDYIQRKDWNLVQDVIGRGRESWIISESAKVQRQIIGQLKSRIASLKARKRNLLLDDLFFTAIRADLMNEPTIFLDNASGQMITEGFAALTAAEGANNHEIKQKLAEPLAVRAVIEYLQENENEDRQARILERILWKSQSSGTAFGEFAEPFIGWAFRGLMAANSLFPERRQEFLGILKNATDANGSLLGALDGHKLIDSHNSRKEEPLGSLDLSEWLERIRLTSGVAPEAQDYIQAICFPEQSAGPDIVFCLSLTTFSGKKDYVLCAFQVKTGLKQTGEEAKLFRTLDPNQWGKSGSIKQSRLRNELHSWDGKTWPALRIVTGLIATSNTCDGFIGPQATVHKTLRRNQQEKRPKNGNNLDFYFAIMDISSCEKVFGHSFSKLCQLMKS